MKGWHGVLVGAAAVWAYYKFIRKA
jgi:hypothetical protein